MKMRRVHAVWLGSAVLASGALFHTTGFPAIPASPPITDAATFYQAALRPLWLFASLHWLLIAMVCVLVTRSSTGAARTILLCCGFTVLIEAAVLYWFIGPFIGVWLLAAAGVAITIAALVKSLPTTAKFERD